MSSILTLGAMELLNMSLPYREQSVAREYLNLRFVYISKCNKYVERIQLSVDLLHRQVSSFLHKSDFSSVQEDYPDSV